MKRSITAERRVVWMLCVWVGWWAVAGCDGSAGAGFEEDVVEVTADLDAAAPDTAADQDTGSDIADSTSDVLLDADALDADIEDGNLDDLADSGALDASDVDDAVTADTAPTDTTVAMDTTMVEPDPGPPAAFLVEMTYTTANIGRTYGTKSDVVAVFDKVGDVIGGKSGPKFIGWQEIGEADPCGDACEWDALKDRFKSASGWDNRRPNSVKVPVTGKGINNDDIQVRRVFASPGWAGVSPTRYVTVVHYKQRNVSVLNTHFIAGAWSCKSNVEQRKDYWRQAWKALKDEVATEHDKGRNVIVTGDLNRPRGSNGCNPSWEPTSLHGRAKIIGGAGIDYIFAVPAAGFKFVVAERADGTKKRGDIVLGIDGHKAHWVRGQFLEQ